MKRVLVGPGEDPVMVNTRDRVLNALLSQQVPVVMACGGKGLCATCHVYVQGKPEALSARTPREELTLKMVADHRPNSRLACQAKVLAEGVKVDLPRGRYIQASSDLESLIGRRAEEPVLHPLTGLVLVEAGKIITRSRILELRTLDVDVSEMKARSATML